MLPELQQAYERQRRELADQAAANKADLEGQAESNRADIRKAAETQRTGARGLLSDWEVTHQAQAQQIRKAQRSEDYLRSLASHKPLDLDTSGKLLSLESVARENEAITRLSLEDVTKRETDAINKVNASLAAAVKSVDDSLTMASESLRTGYEQQSVAFEAQNVRLNNGEYVSRLEFGKLSPTEQEELRQWGIDQFNRIQKEREASAKATAQAAATKTPEQVFAEMKADPTKTIPADAELDSYKVAEDGSITFTYKVKGEQASSTSTPTSIHLQNLADFTEDGEHYNLVAAIRAGHIEDIRLSGAFDPMDVVDAQSAAAEVGLGGTQSLATLTGDEALAALKADTTKNVPQDAVLDEYDPETGQVTFHSPSESVVTITMPDGSTKEVKASEWDKKDELDKLAFVLGRRPTLGEYIGMKAEEADIDLNAIESMPVIGLLATGIEKLMGTRSVYNPKTQKIEQIPPEGVRYWNLKQQAEANYYAKYPEHIYEEAATQGLTELGLPASRVLLPQITFKDIRGEEWLTSGLTVGGVAALGMPGTVGKVAMGAVGAGGSYLTAKHWTELKTDEKAVAVVTNALFFVPLLKTPVKAVREAWGSPNTVKIAVAYESAGNAAKVANRMVSKLDRIAEDNPKYQAVHDATWKAVDRANETENKLVTLLKDNPKLAMTKYVNNRVVTQAAINAKSAHANLVKAFGEAAKSESALLDVKVATRVGKAVEASRLADEAFVSKFTALSQIDPKKLVQLEAKSGYTGLANAVTELDAAARDLRLRWREYTEGRANDIGPEDWRSQKSMARLMVVYKAKVRLQNALDRYSKVIDVDRTRPNTANPVEDLKWSVERQFYDYSDVGYQDYLALGREEPTEAGRFPSIGDLPGIQRDIFDYSDVGYQDYLALGREEPGPESTFPVYGDRGPSQLIVDIRKPSPQLEALFSEVNRLLERHPEVAPESRGVAIALRPPEVVLKPEVTIREVEGAAESFKTAKEPITTETPPETIGGVKEVITKTEGTEIAETPTEISPKEPLPEIEGGVKEVTKVKAEPRGAKPKTTEAPSITEEVTPESKSAFPGISKPKSVPVTRTTRTTEKERESWNRSFERPDPRDIEEAVRSQSVTSKWLEEQIIGETTAIPPEFVPAQAPSQVSIRQAAEEALRNRAPIEFDRISNAAQLGLIDLTANMVRNINDLRAKGLNEVDIRERIRDMTEARVREMTELQTVTKTQAATTTITDTITDAAIGTSYYFPDSALKEWQNRTRETTKKPPRIPVLPSEDTGQLPTLTREPKLGDAIWRMGEPRGGVMYVVVIPPYALDNAYYFRRRPASATKYAEGEGSAYKTFEIVGGKAANDADLDMGSFIAHIRKSVENGAVIEFDRDPSEDFTHKPEKPPREKPEKPWWEERRAARVSHASNRYEWPDGPLYHGHHTIFPNAGGEL